jgi:predicted nuclease with TOPRIM domain
MKKKILLLCVLFAGIFFASSAIAAQPAIIKDIVIDTQDASVKITITSSQTLQIETFKNDESPANYIVLDFIGSVYTNMPSIIDVGKGAVEKVSLVRGEEAQISVDGEPYYSLDFLAINLTSAADYRVSQSQSVIDLSIGAVGAAKIASSQTYSNTESVDLSPPIVVSKKQTKQTKQTGTADKSDYDKYKRMFSGESTNTLTTASSSEPPLTTTTTYTYTPTQTTVNTYSTPASSETSVSYASEEPVTNFQTSSLSEAEKREKARQEKAAMLAAKKAERAARAKKKRRGGFLWFGRRSVEEEEEKEQEPVVQQPVITPVTATRITRTSEGYLIDRVVDETIREKQKTSERIENLTMELKRLQDALYLSKGEKSKLDEKISEILAKLDQLQSALDDEIRRRQALGEKVDDLIAQRQAYIEAKKKYEALQFKLDNITASLERLNADYKQVGSRLEVVEIEKRKLEEDVNTMGTQYSQLKRSYDSALQMKDSVDLTIDQLNREIEALRKKLDRTIDERTRIITDIKNFETQSRLSGNELARLKQLLMDKNAVLIDLQRQNEQLKAQLDLAVSDKFKVEYSYRNAKTEFERIKREIEAYLQKIN